MRKIPSPPSALILILMLLCAVCPATAASGDRTVGSDIPFEDITDFYYTYDASTAPPHYQRYRFYEEDGKHDEEQEWLAKQNYKNTAEDAYTG